MVEFQVYQLSIDLHYDDKYGNKGNLYTAFATYNFGVQDFSGGGNINEEVTELGNRPISQSLGIQPTEYKLSCIWLDSTNKTIKASKMFANIPTYITTPRLYNFILPGMILTVTKNGDLAQLPLGYNYIVKTVVEDQKAGVYDRVNVDLTLDRWYDDIL